MYTVSGVRVCVDRDDGGLPGAVGVCGALNVCVGAWPGRVMLLLLRDYATYDYAK